MASLDIKISTWVKNEKRAFEIINGTVEKNAWVLF